MDCFFHTLFEGDKELSEWFEPIIPTLGITPLRKCLEKDIETVCQSQMTLRDFMLFKYALIQEEEKWGTAGPNTNIFDWTVKKPTDKNQSYFFGI